MRVREAFRNVRQRASNAMTNIKTAIRRRRNRNSSDQAQNPSPPPSPPSTPSSSSSPMSSRCPSSSYSTEEQPRNRNLMFYSRPFETANPVSGSRDGTTIHHKMILAILKQTHVRPGNRRRHCDKLRDAILKNLTDGRNVGVVTSVNSAIQEVDNGGASQFLLVGMFEGVLRGVSAGEVRLIVIRNGAVEFESPCLVHGFGQPVTTADVCAGKNEPELFDFELWEGDVVVFGCAGFWDNVDVERVVENVNGSIQASASHGDVVARGRRVASRLNIVLRRFNRDVGRLIRHGMEDRTWHSPYAERARQNGVTTCGGRNDSCYYMVSLIVDRTSPQIPDIWSLSAV